MALDAGEVFVVVGARIDGPSLTKATAAMKAMKDASDETQRSIDRGAAATDRLHAANDRWARAAVVGAKGAAIGVGTVVAALAGAAVAAANFDSSMRNVNSIAGLSEKGFKNLEAQVLRLSTAVGKSPTDLANGLYSIVSSGFKAADAMKILTAGARAARAGLTDTATATGAITSVLNAYNLGAGQARKVSDLLFQTVNVGVLNFEQLAGSLGKVLPSAKGLGVSLKDLLGAEAALTLAGNSADEATTQLGQVMASLVAPSKSLKKELHDLGYESGQAAIAHLGFKGTLDALGKAANGNQALLKSWFTNIRAFRGVDGLEGTTHAVQLFTSSVKSMDDATKGAGETAIVYAEQQKSTAAQFDHLKASVDVAAVTIGSALLPQINAGIKALTAWLAQAQKSGELQQWASDTAHAVSQVVTFLHSLGPAGAAAFHAISATVQGALPFVEALFHALQAVAPVLEDVAKAAEGLTSALGVGPILAAVAAYGLFRRATLTAQAGMGTFAKIMQAGNLAIAGSVTGGTSAAGKITRIGDAAVEAESGVKIFARGLVSTIGNGNLIAAGVAGIVLGLVALHNSLTDVEKEAQKAADALIHLNDVRLQRQSAALDVREAQSAVTKARATAGSAAVAVANARVNANVGVGEHGQGGAVADPQVTAAINHQKDAILSLQEADNHLAQTQATLGRRTSDLKKAAEDQAKTFLSTARQADLAAKQQVASQRQAEIQQGRTNVATATAAQKADIWADNLVKGSKVADGATAATMRQAAGIAALVKEMGEAPDHKTTQILVDDLKAGRSIKDIRAQLIKLGLLTPKPKVDADTTAANAKIAITQHKSDALNASRPMVHLGASGFDAVSSAISRINTQILHLTSTPFHVNIVEATTTTGGGGTSKTRKKATGGKVDGPEMALIGEDGPEYVIPVSGKHRSGGIALWMAAGKDLGIPGYAAGKKPGKTPPPIKKGLGYDPAALDNQQTNEKKRLDDARTYRDTLNTRLGTDHKHHKTLENELATAKREAGSKNKRTAAAAQSRVTALTKQLTQLDAKIAGEQKARDHQRDVVIPADTKRYQAATAAAKVGDDHAKKITLWQDRADTATSAMSLASDQWDAADRAKSPAGKAKAYAAWLAAQKDRVADLKQVQSLLEEVQKVVGKTDYGAKNAGLLAGALGDIVQAQDDTQAPGYVAPDDSTPSTDLNDYLYQAEKDALSTAALEQARASLTDDTSDDVTAAQDALGVQQWIEARLEQDNAPTDILTQAIDAVASAKSDLANAVTGNTPNGGTVTADQQAALDQQTARATAAQENADSTSAALAAFQQSGDLFRGGQSVTVQMTSLTAGDPTVQRSIATEVTKALGSQGGVPSTTVYYGG